MTTYAVIEQRDAEVARIARRILNGNDPAFFVEWARKVAASFDDPVAATIESKMRPLLGDWLFDSQEEAEEYRAEYPRNLRGEPYVVFQVESDQVARAIEAMAA